MAKPATVERDTYQTKKSDTAETLRLVTDRALKEQKFANTYRKPEVADDIDDMWDNVPV